jgi:hypothetical protein
MREEMIEYIKTQAPKEFRGKENWLGVKMSPHQSMEFINKVTAEGVVTNAGQYSWSECSQQIISTIYQRLKLSDRK